MSKITPIAMMTFRESMRSKILYTVFFFAAIVVAVSALFGTVTIGDQSKVVKDFGLFSISLFSVAYSVISGSTLLSKELTRKTIYNLLSRPVQRWQFVLGKFLGMFYTAAILLSLMALALSAFLLVLEGQPDAAMFQAYFFSLLELSVVCAAAIFFSSIVVTPALSGLFTFCLFLTGRSTEYIMFFVRNSDVGGITADCLQCLYYLLPHLDQLNIVNHVVYGEMVSATTALWATGYAAGYSIVLLALASATFRFREFN